MNLAWTYRPYADERTVAAMYDISADMKSELPTWQWESLIGKSTRLVAVASASATLGTGHQRSVTEASSGG